MKIVYNSHLGNYELSHDDNFIYFKNLSSNITNAVKVIKNDNFVIKENKNAISGNGGAAGVFEFFKNAINENFMTVYINKTIKKYVL